MTILDPDAPEPLYHQLRLELLRRIESFEFGPGDRIPTEMEICDAYGVSRTTARQALQLLADDDILIRARRRGTIVNPRWRKARRQDEVRLVLSDRFREDEIRSLIPPDREATVTVVAYNEIRDYLLRAIAEGNAPDVAMIDHVWVAEFTAAHMIHSLHDLDPTWADSMLRDVIHPAVARGYLYRGDLYAVPEEVNLAGLWYDLGALDLVGAPIPNSWRDLVSVATSLRERRPEHFPIAMPAGEAARETTTYCLTVLLASNGSGIIDGDVVLDSSNGVNTLRFLRSLAESALVPRTSVDAGWLAAPRSLGSGEATISFGGSYETEHIARRSDMSVSDLAERFVFRPFPAGPEGREATVLGGMGFAVFRQSSDPYSALDLIKTITQPAELDTRSIRHGTISPTGTAGSIGGSEHVSAEDLSLLLQNAWTRPIVPGYPSVTKQLQRLVQEVVLGRQRPAAAVERTAEFIGAVTDLPVVHD
ncbi:MAG: extracellular solute-binding protein [Acidimicrobiia bacterium]|nr:extracellular solute-binding protein [Acidimicrobiia bacterium]